MIKTTLTKEKAAQAYATLTILGDKDLPVWYDIVRNLQQLEEPMKAYDKAKQAVIDKLATKGEDGKPVIIDNSFIEFGENKEEALKLFNELAQETIEVELRPIKMAAMKDSSIAPNLIRNLVGTLFVDE